MTEEEPPPLSEQEKTVAAGPEAQVGPAEAPADRRKTPRGPRPQLTEERVSLFREEKGYRLRLDSLELARLRELPGSKGKSDHELGEEFFDANGPRLAACLADLEPPIEVRVLVDPYSRQAFLAVGNTIRGIVSF